MAGKYSALKGSITKFSVELEYQEKVNAKKEEVKGELSAKGLSPTASNLGLILVQARQQKDALEDLVKAQNLVIEAMNQELVDLLESLDFTSLKLGSGVSISIKDDVYCSVRDKHAFHAWIREQGLEDLFSVHYQTMSSMVKEALLEGKETPPGVDPYFKQSIMVRGGKNGD